MSFDEFTLSEHVSYDERKRNTRRTLLSIEISFHRKRLRKIFIVHGKNIDGRSLASGQIYFGEYLC